VGIQYDGFVHRRSSPAEMERSEIAVRWSALLRLAGAVNGIPGWDDQIDTRYPILTFGYHGLESHRHL